MRETEKWPRTETSKNPELGKIEELNLPKEIKETIIQIITLAGNLDKESLEKIVDLNKKGHNLRFLERMVELSREPDTKVLVDDWASYFPLYSLKERTEIERWRNLLSDDEKIGKAKQATKEIGEELEKGGICLKSDWEFGFRVRQKQRKEKILLEKENFGKIFKEYNLPRVIKGEELIDFIYLPPAWKKGILSENFKIKAKELGIKCESFSQLIDTYKKLESRKFRKQRKEISDSEKIDKKITSDTIFKKVI